ncbi:MAG: bifunctional (p)ppGpp synthetase/guanosine-3',5'-bis(diphosphate) 3'-pyrophosphohydrolase [Rhizobiaceae bacterium]|nr:bifunctional (p)ppGpp synthetase/guanosine-3',5'-bis(diphosphate) 3'-pyrophosphohydrolase [Rhizobiaceae bacterium]
MMRQYELVERVTAYKPNADEALLNKAYVYAMQKHGSQKRASGDPYFSHPLEVAAILTDLKLDEETIAVALLHDTIEDTDATRKEIDEIFGEKIGVLVEGLTKIKRIDLVSQKAEQAENLRRLLLAISDDIRVLLVKLADRLHNMRTLDHVRQDKRVRISTETMEIYSPLAGRMGMQDMREELEDLSFRHINPEAYETVTSQLEALAKKNENVIAGISEDLAKLLDENGIKATVKSRRKTAYSVSKKMENKSLGFEQLSDIYGFRVVVESVENCYRALGIVHTNWKMVPSRFKDFISVPKQNDYRSIHTTIVGPSNQRVELQIRTKAMDDIAEYGIAAHSIYKDGVSVDSISPAMSDAYASLRKTIEELAQGENAEEFLEHTKLELFFDQVFCFTPKGQIMPLPSGATPIDFAYAVHTDLGNSCIGCKVNGKITPVVTKLQNGDEVEIIRSKSQSPPSAWEGVVVTGKARSAIRKASREAIRKQYSGLGTRILERALDRSGKVFDLEALEVSLPRLARVSIQDVLSDVGKGELPSSDVIRAVYPDYQDERATTTPPPKGEGWFGLKGGLGMMFRVPGKKFPGLNNKLGRGSNSSNSSKTIPIRGTQSDLPVKFSPNGGAIPGDRIVGILEPGEGITIYPIQSSALAKFDNQSEHWLDVRWDIDENNTRRFPARLFLTVINEPGTLAGIAEVVANNDGNIQNLVMETPDSDFTQMQMDVDVWDLSHLNRIIRQLSKKPVVNKIERITN